MSDKARKWCRGSVGFEHAWGDWHLVPDEEVRLKLRVEHVRLGAERIERSDCPVCGKSRFRAARKVGG